MTEQELRALVRDTVARHLAGRPAPAGAASTSPLPLPLHASHGLLALPAGIDSDGPCIIEPSVPCNHCGYCKSYGH